jgi:hypothetical protein
MARRIPKQRASSIIEPARPKHAMKIRSFSAKCYCFSLRISSASTQSARFKLTPGRCCDFASADAPPLRAAAELTSTGRVFLDCDSGSSRGSAEVLGATRLDELIYRDRRRRLSLAAFSVTKCQRRGSEGALLVAVQRQRLHGIGRRVDRLEVVEDAERPVDHVILDVALVRDADVVGDGAADQPLQQTKRKTPASIWYELAPSWELMRMISLASVRAWVSPAWRIRIMCFVYSVLPATRLRLWATMNGSKPSFFRPRRTSMVGM